MSLNTKNIIITYNNIDSVCETSIDKEYIKDSMDECLYTLFGNDDVPEYVNITLKNKLDYAASHSRKKIDLWWMPAIINTVMVFTIVVLSIVMYFMIRIGGSFTIIPNIIDSASVLGFKIVIIWACFHIILGWLSTAIIIPIASGRSFSKGIKMI